MDRTRGRGNSAHPGLTASPSGQSLLWPLRRRHCDGAFRHRHPFAHSTMGSRRASAVGRQRVDRERCMGGGSGSGRDTRWPLVAVAGPYGKLSI